MQRLAGPLLVLAALGLAGCGSSSAGSAAAQPTASAAVATNGEELKPASQVVADAVAALKAAPTVHVQGTTKDSDGSAMTLDETYSGGNSSIMVTQNGMTVSVIAVGGKAYIKAPVAYWTTAEKASAAVAARLANRWIIGNPAALADLSLPTLADSLAQTDTPLKPEVTTVQRGGGPVVVVTDTDGSTVEVAGTGTPLPVRGTDTTTTPTGVITFDYAAADPITAPSGALTPQQAVAG